MSPVKKPWETPRITAVFNPKAVAQLQFDEPSIEGRCLCGHHSATHHPAGGESPNQGCSVCEGCTEFRSPFEIPMILGVRTLTDSYELWQYMKELVNDSGEINRELYDTFDSKFPGVRTAVVRAMKEVQMETKSNCTLLEFIGGRFRARNDDKVSEWYPATAEA